MYCIFKKETYIKKDNTLCGVESREGAFETAMSKKTYIYTNETLKRHVESDLYVYTGPPRKRHINVKAKRPVFEQRDLCGSKETCVGWRVEKTPGPPRKRHINVKAKRPVWEQRDLCGSKETCVGWRVEKTPSKKPRLPYEPDTNSTSGAKDCPSASTLGAPINRQWYSALSGAANPFLSHFSTCSCHLWGSHQQTLVWSGYSSQDR